MRRFMFGRLLLASLLVALFSGFGLIMYQVGSYFDYLDAYSGHIARQDESAAREGLQDLQYFYEQNRKLDVVRLSWLGRDYVFEDSACQRAAFSNLTKNYRQTVEKELNDQESFCASFLRGVARWRQAQAISVNALTLPNKTAAQKEERENQLKLADDLATLAKDDFEAALKANPDHAPSSWDYDFLSNPETRAAGLKPKPGKIKVRVGQDPGGGSGGPGPKGEDDDEGKGEKSKDIDTDNQGPGQPGKKSKKVG